MQSNTSSNKDLNNCVRSFIDVAPESDFSLANLPYGIFSPAPTAKPRAGVAIGELVLDLSAISASGLLGPKAQALDLFSDDSLNRFLAQGKESWSFIRSSIQNLLHYDNPTLRDNQELRARAFFRTNQVKLWLPIKVGGYTDFYSSIDHAKNVGTLIRGAENALNPNWRYMPIGYDGRAGSIAVSGTDFKRPFGQSRPKDDAPPVFGAESSLDFELELAFVVGTPGSRIATHQVDDHVFGALLLNDCSARSIQRWEYQPLGPFLGKNFGTVVSPWLVPLEALNPFRIKGCVQEPEPFEYLRSERQVFDINLEVELRTAKMPPDGGVVITRTNSKFLYWDHTQQLAHHTVNGCRVFTGDIFATGTISGPTPESLGCLLELTKGGKEPLHLPNGEERRFLNDGDQVTMRGWAEKKEGQRVGFGEVTTTVVGL